MRAGETWPVRHQSANFIWRTLQAHLKELCCTVGQDSMQAAFPLHGGARTSKSHASSQLYKASHSLLKPGKQSARRRLERTICCCRQQERTTFRVKASTQRPPGWLASHFYVSPKLHFALKTSLFLRHFQKPRVQTSRHRQAALRLQNNKP